MLYFCDFIQVFVFTRNHHLNIFMVYMYLYGCIGVDTAFYLSFVPNNFIRKYHKLLFARNLFCAKMKKYAFTLFILLVLRFCNVFIQYVL